MARPRIGISAFLCSVQSARQLFIRATCLISLLFPTNFQLGEWIRAFIEKKSVAWAIGIEIAQANWALARGTGVDPENGKDAVLAKINSAGPKNREIRQRPRRGRIARAGTDRARIWSGSKLVLATSGAQSVRKIDFARNRKSPLNPCPQS